MAKEMIKCEKIRERLKKLFGKKILCRIGEANPTYKESKEKFKRADIAVYIHKKHRVALVWDLKNRRENNRVTASLSVSERDWSVIKPEKGQIKAIYKHMGTDATAPTEKVLVLDADTLFLISEELNYYVIINPDDIEYPIELKNTNDLKHEFLDAWSRKRFSTSSWERDRKFRNAVLNAYNRKCAICRCKEEKLLEAAHIKAVADGGTDSPENGVCLCANHHIMFDRKLIKIDFDKHTLVSVAGSVRDMPWYSVFKEEFDGKMLLPSYGIAPRIS